MEMKRTRKKAVSQIAAAAERGELEGARHAAHEAGVDQRHERRRDVDRERRREEAEALAKGGAAG